MSGAKRKTRARAIGLRSLREGPLEIQSTEGAWPLCVRDDGGQLKIWLLEDPNAKPAVLHLTLLHDGVEVEGRLAPEQFIGLGIVSGHAWLVFEGIPS